MLIYWFIPGDWKDWVGEWSDVKGILNVINTYISKIRKVLDFVVFRIFFDLIT